MKKLKAITKKVTSLSEEDIDELFNLYQSYYSAARFENFDRDLSDKDHIFLMHDHQGLVKGFSTVKKLSFTSSTGNKVFGIFSGDTIIDKEYWGQSALQIAFIKYFITFKFRHFFDESYWFLLSKGYKTYLLMANNFTHYFPRYDVETPEYFSNLIHSFASKSYTDYWNQQSGLIKFEESQGHLKGYVAPITENMRVNNKIEYFEKLNPTWADGTELVCIAKLDASSPIRYITKTLCKKLGIRQR